MVKNCITECDSMVYDFFSSPGTIFIPFFLLLLYKLLLNNKTLLELCVRLLLYNLNISALFFLYLCLLKNFQIFQTFTIDHKNTHDLIKSHTKFSLTKSQNDVIFVYTCIEMYGIHCVYIYF